MSINKYQYKQHEQIIYMYLSGDILVQHHYKGHSSKDDKEV